VVKAREQKRGMEARREGEGGGLCRKRVERREGRSRVGRGVEKRDGSEGIDKKDSGGDMGVEIRVGWGHAAEG